MFIMMFLVFCIKVKNVFLCFFISKLMFLTFMPCCNTHVGNTFPEMKKSHGNENPQRPTI